MPSDDYAIASTGGALKLKGSKVDKKKKKKKDKSDLAKNLSTGSGNDDGSVALAPKKEKKENDGSDARDEKEDENREESDDGRAAPRKTESELRHEAQRKKRVSHPLSHPGSLLFIFI